MIYIGGEIMRKYPFVKQEEIKDCGISCISMLVKYYNGFIKRDKLIEMTKTNKNGTTAFHIKDTLEEIGFSVKGVKCNLSDLNKDNIILPCIANVVIDNSIKHFIVIYEINFKSKYLIIGDPADKIKKISFEDFNPIFNKVLIIAFPSKQIPYEKDINLINFIKELATPHKKLLINILILSIFTTLFSIITSFYFKYIIESISKYSKTLIIIIYILFFSTHILKIVSEYFRNILMTYINQKIELVLTLDVFNKIIELPYRYYHSKQTGDIISKINDLDIIRNMISKLALTLFIDFPLTLVSLIILYMISDVLFKIGLIILVLYLIILFVFKNTINNYLNKLKTKKSNYVSYMIDSIRGFESIKGTHLEKSIKNKFENKYIKFSKDMFKFQSVYFFQNFLKEIVDNIGFITIIFIGSILVLNNRMDIGTLLTFTSLLTYFLTPIKSMVNLDNTFKESKIALRRVIELIDFEKENNITNNQYTKGDILFKSVNYTFNDKDYVLKNVNLCIKESSKVMAVGKSGCGKSTLFKLLMKYYKVMNNKIFINNVDINFISDKDINDNIIYIGQNEMLFNDTLYNNLIFDNSDSSNLMSVAKICEINEILDSNLGFNMLLEENGFNLSGGQKQRIILARALLKKFDVLIIDEGLNQVDIDLERRILKNIFKKYKDKTIIVISHRLDNLDLFDSLIEFKDGQVKDVKRNV